MGRLRVYDAGSSIARSILEDVTKCIAEVGDYSGWHTLQCSRNRGFGPDGEYCKQHAKMKAQDGIVRVPFKERET